MNPIARQLNEALEDTVVSSVLSDLGRRFYFPKGIVAQTGEAKKHATRHNATVGMAFQGGEPLHLSGIRRELPGLDPADIFAYSTTSGEPDLRSLWKEQMIRKNPGLANAKTSLPLVVSGLTHGLSVTADLFADPDDPVILPDLFWGNYRLIFAERRQARLETFPFFGPTGGLNAEGLVSAVRAHAGGDGGPGKAVVLLNFPNNPTGYSPTRGEAEELLEALAGLADEGFKLVVVTDDAYFGLFYEEQTYRESLFAPLAAMHPNILAVKVDGTTKEDLSWGFRIGFLTFASKGLSEEQYNALERKTMGLIRATISNASRPAQSLLIRGMRDGRYDQDKAAAFESLKRRYLRVRSILESTPPPSYLHALPFNSGYFMCFRSDRANAEEIRLQLLHGEGIGTISFDASTLRVAFSMPDEESLDEIYRTLFEVAEKLG